jgi:hypothetical protein
LPAAKLVEEFGIDINVEDPVVFAPDDVQNFGVAQPGKFSLIPKPALLELRIPLQPDGSLASANAAVRDLVDTANGMLPYAYRLNTDPFRIVPTQTRDEHGQSDKVIPVLDTRVTIPRGKRRIIDHITLLTQALQQQTGVQIRCCQGVVIGTPWGSTVIDFEASQDESARDVLLRLVRNEPGPTRLVRNEKDGLSHLVRGDYARDYWRWSMRCQPNTTWCFINISAIPDKVAQKTDSNTR